ncbi:hypothetical protein HO133_011075 [Letharia lupina]|uniref:UBC core domain-containing protein n=1 Tax=Letharia lupina TaxID=560253 RepID=A0A8H6CJ75_9LECA|nr:uncharacterized protein HO133_011075 [Letharia lupina]KAF6224498.1 hypothetical protein HO133_011075 [Letharia lupina]
MPLRVRKAWFDNAKLTPGYVIIAFSQDYDGYCLVAESSLQLIDRSLAAGDVVKKRLSDAQSGTVIATSLMCSLRPTCSQADFSRRQHPPVQVHTPSHGPRAPRHDSKDATTPSSKLVHGFPAPTSPEVNGLKPLNSAVSPFLQAPASELKFWNTYREEDNLMYKGWIGEVRSVYDEVTIRLANGSVVVVEDPEELDEPYWIPGTPSYELAQRLDCAGYYQYCPKQHAPGVGQTRSIPAEPCYPGQHVQTKKGNLRCGRWKFGAYDPAITPRGIVVDVRNVQIEVRWLSPIASQDAPPLQPSTLLDTEELQTGEIIVFDRSKLPKQLVANASYSPDTGFGNKVRFRDPTGAAVKYGPASKGATHPDPTPVFDRIPRAATQGFDMNVLQVVATSTKVTVRWQDCSITEDDSAQLFPYLNPDENDVWPGEKVSFLPDEEKMGDQVPIIRLHKVGVVQSVDARERIARVRWFEGTEIDIDEEEKASQYSASTYGKLRNEVVEVALYDIAAHAALALNLGDLVRIAPEQALSPAHAAGGEDLRSFLSTDPDGDVDMPYAYSSSLPLSRVAQPSLLFNPGFLTAPLERAQTFMGLAGDDPGSTPQGRSLSQGNEWVGEIIDLCLNGEVVIRLGAASEARDVKVPVERVVVVASTITGSSDYSEEDDDDDGESYFSDAMSVSDGWSDRETDQESVGAIDVTVEYEGGEKFNDDDDEGMWATDEDDVGDLDMQKSSDDENPPVYHLEAVNDDLVQLDRGLTLEPPNLSSNADTATRLSSCSSMPPPFFVLEDAAPSDHHFFGLSRPLTADLMRRVMKEHKIMQSSLPDGIFVRSWESRLDLLRVLIVGPFDTPYEFAPFVVDLHFGLSFPASPPDAFFHSWTGGLGRINPNLYEDGKICLSLLGTWNADERNEEWSSKRSTVLQILVSLMGLVLVKEPYYNEAGFDVLIGSADSQLPSALYNEKVYVMSKGFIKTALITAPNGFADVIQWLYLSSQPGPNLLRRVVEDSKKLLANSTTTSAVVSASGAMDEGGSTRAKLSTGASILLRRNVEWLEDFMVQYDKGIVAMHHGKV